MKLIGKLMKLKKADEANQKANVANQKLQKRNEEIVRSMLKKVFFEEIININQVAGSRIREIAKEMNLSIEAPIVYRFSYISCLDMLNRK